MKVIFNSDMLFVNSLVKEALPPHLGNFLVHCGNNGHEIIVPATTLFEFDRAQADFLQREINAIKGAQVMLRSYGVVMDDFAPEDKVKKPDLLRLIKDLGVKCIRVDPTREDYDDAHRKACLREAPHPPDVKSDEMRDLVIWAVAIRLAKQNGGALLLSRDVVHTHYRGDLQASDSNLLRINDLERAREILDIETEAAKTIKARLDAAWDKILASDLPITGGAQVLSILRPRFVELPIGSTRAYADIALRSGDGKEIVARLNIEYRDNLTGSVQFHPIPEHENSLESKVHVTIGELESDKSDVEQRFQALRELLEGAQ